MVGHNWSQFLDISGNTNQKLVTTGNTLIFGNIPAGVIGHSVDADAVLAQALHAVVDVLAARRALFQTQFKMSLDYPLLNTTNVKPQCL